MIIHVTTGVGEARTSLAAFDRALFEAGIANFNLIVLSSVIPTGAEIVQKQLHLNDDAWGDKLYVVLAQQIETRAGREAWAGIGWVQEEESGKGLFVEHHGDDRIQLELQINESLDSMTAYRQAVFGPPQMVVAGLSCTDRPVCALVAAVLHGESWAERTAAA